tara:strand:- start:849 stop:1352 length:504 start_codon:yes stop_codon:yes gene_type:complete
MALEFISKDIASSTPTTLKVTGIDTDAVHVVVFNDVVPSADERLGVRVTKGGTIQSDANYDNGRRGFTISGGFQSNADTGENEILLGTAESTGPGANGYFYLYGFNSGSEFSFVTFHSMMWASSPAQFQDVGGGVHRVSSASDGLSFFFDGGGTFANGSSMALYKLI